MIGALLWPKFHSVSQQISKSLWNSLNQEWTVLLNCLNAYQITVVSKGETPWHWDWMGFIWDGFAGSRYPDVCAILCIESLVPTAAERYWGAKLVILNLCEDSPQIICLESDVKHLSDPKSFKTEVNAPAIRLYPLWNLLHIKVQIKLINVHTKLKVWLCRLYRYWVFLYMIGTKYLAHN